MNRFERSSRSFEESIADAGWWGRLVENAVGGILLGNLPAAEYAVTYWRQGDREVDFVIARGARLWAIEVNNGRQQ